MGSAKTNKNRAILLKTNISWLETLIMGPKRFLHSKCPKNAICLHPRLRISNGIEQYSLQATVTTIWKTPVCKRSILKWPVSCVVNFGGWIKRISDKITSIYSVKNAFNPTSEFHNIENGVFRNALFVNATFANGFPNGDNSCLWAQIQHCLMFLSKMHHIAKNWKCFYDFQYKVTIWQCEVKFWGFRWQFLPSKKIHSYP